MNTSARSAAVAVLFVSAIALGAPDPRCKGGLEKSARRFSEQAMKGTPEAERYAAFVKACGLDEVVALTKSLVSIPTVSADAPEKKAPAFAAMAKLLGKWAKAHGLTFRAVGKNDVFEMRWGEGAPKLGLVFHGDVVPAPQHEWKRPPFKPVVVEGRLYGRGVEDDKGPLATALVTLAMAKAMGFQPDGQVVVMVGNGEENGWDPMREYAEKDAPKLEHVISVDASFPVVAAQSGFVAWTLTTAEGVSASKPQSADGKLAITEAHAGEFLTQVPGEAVMTLVPNGIPLPEAKALVEGAIAELARARKDFKAEVKAQDGALTVTTHGNAVHASVADEGHNALWDLAALAQKLSVQRTGVADLLSVVAKDFDGDHFGQKLGIAYEDALMGKLLVAPTVLRTEKDRATLRINMRRPQGKDPAAFAQSLDQSAKKIAQDSGGHVVPDPEGRYIGDPHVADVSGPLVTTLLGIYQKHRGGNDLKPTAVRGGTYARLFPRGVDFGPGFPGETYSGHAPDESISLANLDALAQMLADAIYQLGLKQTPSEQ